LRLICGLTTAEIARAFLMPEKTLGQRISRAKRTLSEAHVPFETPCGDDLRRRVESVLSVVYLLHSVRGDLLTKMGRFTEAREEIQRAITMTQNLREQELLTEKTQAD
jgi:predicted RNA polymerase sigma factor